MKKFVIALNVCFAVMAGLLIFSRVQISKLNCQVESLKNQKASVEAQKAEFQRRLENMTKRYEEEFADRTALMNYFGKIPKKMDFAHPFGFSLRAQIDKSRILPGGIYIKEGDYEGFETGEMVVDRDTMAFAKISGYLDPETPFADENAVLSALKKRMKAAFDAKPYPFEVSYSVEMNNGRLEFSIIDVEMYKKMEAREQKSFRESAEMMKSYRSAAPAK
jgi:hypothetical protein